MNGIASRKVWLVAGPVAALVFYWLWRRRRNGSRPSLPASSSSNRGGASSSSRQKTTVELEVPDYAMGFVIGRGGQNIRMIESESGARVKMFDVPDEKNGRTQIFGFPDQVARAEALIRKAISDKERKIEESQKATCTLEIVIPPQAIGRVIGHRGETIRNIERISKARVRVERESHARTGEKKCIITGTEEQASAAANMVRDEIAQEAIEQKSRGHGPRATRNAATVLPTADQCQLGIEPVDVDWPTLSSRLPPTSNNLVDVFVSSTCHPHCFWVQTISEAGKGLEELTHVMTQYYSSQGSAVEVLSKVKVGDVCAALFVDDGKWYRSRIMSIQDNEVDVLFLDFGDSQFMSRQDIRALKPEYLQLPFQAVMCSLDGISPKDGTNEWSAEACDLLLQLTGAGMWKTLVLEVISLPRGSKSPDSLFPEPALVDLVDTSSENDVYITQSLLDAGMAIRSGDLPPAPPVPANAVSNASTVGGGGGDVSASFQDVAGNGSSTQSGSDSCRDVSSCTDVACHNSERTPVILDLGQVQCARHVALPASAFGGLVQVRVSAVQSPSLFWVQLSCQLDEIEALNDQITSEYSELDEDEMVLSDAKKGMVCCAAFGHDETWHRAVIVDFPEEDLVKVQYLDYGDTLTIRLADVKELREEYLELPFQAVALRMANIISQEGSWTQNSIDQFENFTHAASWQSILVNLVEPSTFAVLPQVELFTMVDEGQSVSEMMISAGCATWKTGEGICHSLTSEPFKLVEEALLQAEEQDQKEEEEVLQNSIKDLPVLARSLSGPTVRKLASKAL